MSQPEFPVLFVQVLAFLYKRSDDGQDPHEWQVGDPNRHMSLGNAAYRLLDQITRIPGTDTEGRVDLHALSQWIAEVRRSCTEYGRVGIGDQKIGELLSKAPEEDNLWPCRPVCEVLQAIASEDVAKGFEIGVYNARGVHSRSLDEGGEQERALAAKYRAWAQRWKFDYPLVARILDGIAERYDYDAEREDSDVLLVKRLEH